MPFQKMHKRRSVNSVFMSFSSRNYPGTVSNFIGRSLPLKALGGVYHLSPFQGKGIAIDFSVETFRKCPFVRR